MAMISGLRPLSPFWRRQAPTSPAERYYITPWAEPGEPVRKAEPIPDRTLGSQGRRPGGAINPRARKGESTFGNTVKRRFLLKAYCLRVRRRKAVYKMAPHGAVHPQRSGTI
jgi:hypothetical protein